MEYFRDPKNQIYADIAYRMGKIVVQYEKIKTAEEKFEATLYIVALQNLMTICNEHVRKMTKIKNNDSLFKKNLESAGWGLKNECWIKNTFMEEQNLQNFITRIRNSVSHPTPIRIDSTYPSTGFTTLLDDSGMIKKYRFINSPDTSNNRIKIFQSEDQVDILEYSVPRFWLNVYHRSGALCTTFCKKEESFLSSCYSFLQQVIFVVANIKITTYGRKTYNNEQSKTNFTTNRSRSLSTRNSQAS